MHSRLHPSSKALLTLGLTVLMLGSSSRAAVIYSGLQNIPIPTDFDGIYLDLDTATTSTSTITGWDINPFFGGVGIAASAAFQPARVGTGNMDTIIMFALNQVIDGSYFFAGAQETGSADHLGSPGNFQSGVSGYLGFKFTTNSANGPYYGWMRLTLTANTSGALIQDWAWEDTGGSILAGVLLVPEPTRAMLMLLGFAALLIHRRRDSLKAHTSNTRLKMTRNIWHQRVTPNPPSHRLPSPRLFFQP